MFKKAVLLFVIFSIAVMSHLRPCCDYELDGVRIASGISPRAAAHAELTARAAAEEILPTGAVLPVLRRHTRLRFTKPSDDARMLTDALLRAADGIVLRDEVRVGGTRLGWVADGAALREALDAYIINTLPAWACGGIVSREVSIRRLYTRDGWLTAQGDMVLLITSAAPVFYFDTAGRYARA